MLCGFNLFILQLNSLYQTIYIKKIYVCLLHIVSYYFFNSNLTTCFDTSILLYFVFDLPIVTLIGYTSLRNTHLNTDDHYQLNVVANQICISILLN